MSNRKAPDGWGNVRLSGEVLNWFYVYLEQPKGWQVMIPKGYQKLFKVYVDKYYEGDEVAILKDMFDRTMGKPKQTIDITTNGDKITKSDLTDDELEEIRKGLAENHS